MEKENYTYLIKKKRLQRLDVFPFLMTYGGIFYLSQDIITDPLYIKFLFLIVFFIHGMIFLIGNWKNDWKLVIQFSKTTEIEKCEMILIEGTKDDGSFYSEICEKKKDENGRITMSFQKKEYEYDAKADTFVRLIPDINLPIKHFVENIDSKGYEKYKNYPDNLLSFPLPNFNKIFKEQLMDPLNFFQLFSIALWFFDDNFFHPIFTLLMVVFSIFSVAIDRMTTMMNLRSLILKPQYIQCYRDGKWVKLSSEKLKPGDIVSIKPSNKIKEPKSNINPDDEIALLRKNIPFGEKLPKKMFMKMKMQGKSQSKPVLPCDFLLLSGSCIVDESILTGESVPLIKDSIENITSGDEILDLKAKHKGNLLYCGTEVLQNFPPEDLPKCVDSQAPDGGAIAYVLRTGFDTAKGELARSVIFNNENIGLKNTEAFLLLAILLVLSIFSSAEVLKEGLKDESRDKQKLFLRCIMIITSVVPPELPMIMNISINYSLMYLRKKKIFCTEPVRIPLAGRIDICAFDKTGTLTTDRLEIVGVCENEKNGKIKKFDAISNQNKVIMSGCHTLIVHKGELLGDPIEKLFFEHSNFKYDHSIKKAYNSKMMSESLSILKVFQFRADLKRMSTVCKVTGFPGFQTGNYVLAKGAPEVIGKFLKEKNQHYDECASNLMKEGYRVLSLAYKKTQKNPHDITREEAESDLIFAGLLVLSCPMKKDTPKYINMLREAKYKNVMITGDNMYTAAKTGQTLKFGPPKHLFLIHDEGTKFHWANIHDKKVVDLEVRDLEDLEKKWCLCVEGGSMKALLKDSIKKDTKEATELFEKVILTTTIFARVSPEQKEKIVTVMREHGKGVLMCGDGTNDVGALKKSDVGIALVGLKDEPTAADKKAEEERKKKIRDEAFRKRDRSLLEMLNVEDDVEFKSGDACIAAPFTNKFSNSLKCVITVMRQGICTMTTTIQTYKILTLQSFILAYSMSSLHMENLKSSDMQNTVIGIFGAYYFFQLSNSKPVKKIPARKPEASIFNVPFWLSIIGQALILLVGMKLCLHYSKKYSWEDDLKITNEEEFKPTFRNSMMFLYDLVSMFCISIFNHEGEPFMQKLADKKGHMKYILAPLVISMLLTLDVSDDLNDLMNITLDANYEQAHYVFFGLFSVMVLSCYLWTRMIKKIRFGQCYGYL